jgi:hypothetical protein
MFLVELCEEKIRTANNSKARECLVWFGGKAWEHVWFSFVEVAESRAVSSSPFPSNLIKTLPKHAIQWFFHHSIAVKGPAVDGP